MHTLNLYSLLYSLLRMINIDVSKVNEKGATPLHYITKHPYCAKQASVIEKILTATPTIVTATNKHGETALHAACLKGNHKTVVQLLHHRAPVNALTHGGEAPLHYAITSGNPVVVNVLLKAGADANVEAKRGTPLDLAMGYLKSAFASIFSFDWNKI